MQNEIVKEQRTVPKIDNYTALRERFDSWEKEKLIQYALSITKAISERDQAKQAPQESNGQNPLLQSMAIVQEIGESLL